MKRLVIFALLAGCGGAGTVELDDLGAELARASCAKQFECCTDAELVQQYMGITVDGEPITTEAQCVEFGNALLSGLAVPQYRDSLAKGRIEYDGAAAADCIAAIDRLTCAQYASGQAGDEALGCRPFIIPKVGAGGGCTQDGECTSGNCVGATVQPDGPDTDGMCQPMPTAGQACTGDCADGLFCGFDQTSGARVCQPTRADGMPCTLDRECASDHCDDTDTCAPEPPTCDGR